jgi:protein-disulfide isomerase
MKTYLLIASGILVAALSAVPFPAHAKTMKECAAEWKEMKAANQTAGMKYRDFSKQCMSGEAAPAAGAAPAATAPAATAPAAETTAPAAAPAAQPAAKPAAKPMSKGREAMIARERACGADWKADKAAGKIQAGMKWPQYWSECNKRKKAEGM